MTHLIVSKKFATQITDKRPSFSVIIVLYKRHSFDGFSTQNVLTRSNKFDNRMSSGPV